MKHQTIKTGLFFGSFNPIHIGHLAIANYMSEFTVLDQVWLIVSPHNPLKKKSTLLNDYDRLEMAQIAVGDCPKISVSNVEFLLPKPSYTIDTITYLKERFPKNQFILIMGSDGLPTLPKWKNYEILIRDFKILVYPRPGFAGHPLLENENIELISAPMIEISSSFIREAIKAGKDVRFFLPLKVYDLICQKGYYH